MLLTTRSPIRMSPSLTSSRPAIMRSAVVLPHPDGPTKTTNSPSWTSRFRSETARKPSSYVLLTLWKVISAMGSRSLFLHGAGGGVHDPPLEDEEQDCDRNRHQHRRGQ